MTVCGVVVVWMPWLGGYSGKVTVCHTHPNECPLVDLVVVGKGTRNYLVNLD